MMKQDKIRSIKDGRRRKKHYAWLRIVQVIGVAATLALIYNGATSLVRLNASYLENTIAPAQKINATANPEAKAFAAAFVAEWLHASRITPSIQSKLSPSLIAERMAFPAIKQINQVYVRDVDVVTQYQGVLLLEAQTGNAQPAVRYTIELTLRYLPEEKTYQVTDYPKLIKQ
ncbi:hypothetical protein [Aneurinibacillus sp. REN35]|uniref:hypothetical protein n=1 Tax=Aneurinibacillus sp. REN35 TaxID=3237286 RepID=UPI0035289679